MKGIRKNVVADISAEERYYSRSLKIRLGVMDALRELASSGESQRLVWDSLEDLAGFAANQVFREKWDSKPASSVTTARWCKQYLLPNGPFAADDRGHGSFVVSFRTQGDASQIERMLKSYRRKNGRERDRQAKIQASIPPGEGETYERNDSSAAIGRVLAVGAS